MYVQLLCNLLAYSIGPPTNVRATVLTLTTYTDGK